MNFDIQIKGLGSIIFTPLLDEALWLNINAYYDDIEFIDYIYNVNEVFLPF